MLPSPPNLGFLNFHVSLSASRISSTPPPLLLVKRPDFFGFGAGWAGAESEVLVSWSSLVLLKLEPPVLLARLALSSARLAWISARERVETGGGANMAVRLSWYRWKQGMMEWLISPPTELQNRWNLSVLPSRDTRRGYARHASQLLMGEGDSTLAILLCFGVPRAFFLSSFLCVLRGFRGLRAEKGKGGYVWLRSLSTKKCGLTVCRVCGDMCVTSMFVCWVQASESWVSDLELFVMEPWQGYGSLLIDVSMNH